jgi:hypothetical protein
MSLTFGSKLGLEKSTTVGNRLSRTIGRLRFDQDFFGASEVPGLPEEANQYLLERLDDPAPSVQAAAVIAFADSTTEYHTLAKNRVAKVAIHRKTREFGNWRRKPLQVRVSTGTRMSP